MGKKLTKKKQQKTVQNQENNREILMREAGLEYAQAVKMLGEGRLEINCFDGKTRMGHIRGKINKRVWISPGDILLVALRDFQDDKADIVHKYSLDEIKELKKIGQIPSDTKIDTQIKFNDNSDEDIDIFFEDI